MNLRATLNLRFPIRVYVPIMLELHFVVIGNYVLCFYFVTFKFSKTAMALLASYLDILYS